MADAHPPQRGYGIPVEDPDAGSRGSDLDQPGAQGMGKRRRPWIIGGVVALIVLAVTVGLVVWFSRTPLGVLAGAVSTTLEQETSATRVDATLVGVPIVGDVNLVVATGAVDFSSGEARFEREFFGGVTTELRYVRDGVFLQVPFADDRWVALAEGAPPVDGFPGDVTTVAPGIANPVTLLAMIRSLESTPTEVGREQAAGVPVTLWEVVVDLDATADLLGEDAAGLIADLRRLTGGGELPLIVGIDDDGLIRTVRFTLRVPVSPTLAFDVDNAIVFTEFGVPVEVSAPPEDRIVELDASALRGLDPLGALRELLESLPLPTFG